MMDSIVSDLRGIREADEAVLELVAQVGPLGDSETDLARNFEDALSFVRRRLGRIGQPPEEESVERRPAETIQ